MRDIDWVEAVFIGIMTIIVLALVLVIVDCSVGHREYEIGIVEEKVFSPGKTGTGVGPNIGGNGGIAIVVTSSSDEWHILVKTKTDLIDAEVNKAKWVAIKIGNTVRVCHWIGGISKSVFDSTIE